MTDQMREIVTAYLIINGEEPVIFSSNEDKVNKIISKASEKNICLKKRKITSNRERILQIGNNFFKRKTPLEALINPIQFRNKLIKEWHDTVDRLSELIKVNGQLSWTKICNKNNIEPCTVDDFSKWMLDINEFIKN